MADDKIKLRCTACDARVRAGAHLAGKPLKCPKCGKTAPFEAVVQQLELQEEPPPAPPVATGASCPTCRAAVAEDDVICVQCGTNLKLGLNVKTLKRARSAGNFGLAVAVSAGSAMLAAAVWAGITVVTMTEIGWIAIGVGFIAGFGVGMMTTERGLRVSAAAAANAAAGILIGKILILNWAIGPLIVPQYIDDPVTLAFAVRYELTDGDEDAEVDEAKLQAKLLALRNDREERKRVVQRFVEAGVARMSYVERIKATWSPYDILWILLAIGAALKVVRKE